MSAKTLSECSRPHGGAYAPSVIGFPRRLSSLVRTTYPPKRMRSGALQFRRFLRIISRKIEGLSDWVVGCICSQSFVKPRLSSLAFVFQVMIFFCCSMWAQKSTSLRPFTHIESLVRLFLAATTSHFFLNVLLQACYFAGSFVYHEEPIDVGLKKVKFLKLTHP